ncbi:peptidylprolyl isomerase [Telmatospirillum siberiense]|uniref:Parvulin-like PPIase n=1 Tax=Telmatospirillum siberiense TaxID=382514 RepID=A0A2N3PMM0_9PROT|nr:peptidylprolyl isomerase [Telmatospirillum siberiense]PKU21649.1 parvulin peptidyl-prolyl isomerase [Telmatospirillum siberiense]
MIHRNVRVAALAALMAAVAMPVLAADADPVVASVNGKDIHRSAVIDAQQGIPQLRQMPLEMVYDQLLDHVVTAQLLLDQAKKQKLEDDPQVKAAFKDAQARILQQAFLAKRVDSDISEDAMKKRYEELKKSYQPKEEVKVSHILVETEEAAKTVIADLKSGVKFEDEAKAKTKDPSGSSNGGDLGFIGKGDTVPEFSDAAFKLKPGEITETPVKTQFGWHVIKAGEHRMAAPPSYEDSKGAIKNELAQQDVQKVIDGLKKSAQVKKFNLDGSPLVEKVKQ